MMPEQSRDDDYSAAGFDGSLVFGSRPALLIVDVVMAYLAKDSPLYAGVEAELAANERLLAAARAAGIPVIFTNVVYEPGGFSGGMFYRKVPALKAFERGSPLGEFPNTLQPNANEIVLSKQYPSAFFGTPLAGMLVAAGIDTLLITGYSTSGCVRATALDALCHGFAPFVVKDASGDRDPQVQQANLFDIQAKIGEVIGCEAALAHLSAIQSRHEEKR